MLVVATGAISPDDAKSLLVPVNYEADVTWNENTYTGKKNNLGNLILNIFMLCAILMAFSAVAGLAFGGYSHLLQPHLAGERAAPRKGDGIHLPESG